MDEVTSPLPFLVPLLPPTILGTYQLLWPHDRERCPFGFVTCGACWMLGRLFAYSLLPQAPCARPQRTRTSGTASTSFRRELKSGSTSSECIMTVSCSQILRYNPPPPPPPPPQSCLCFQCLSPTPAPVLSCPVCVCVCVCVCCCLPVYPCVSPPAHGFSLRSRMHKSLPRNPTRARMAAVDPNTSVRALSGFQALPLP